MDLPFNDKADINSTTIQAKLGFNEIHYSMMYSHFAKEVLL